MTTKEIIENTFCLIAIFCCTFAAFAWGLL
jgi:hypothetical protein